MKLSLVLLALTAVMLASCTTLENRRDMFFPQKVNGPYTRMVKDNFPKYRHVSVAVPGGKPASDGKSVVR